LVAGQLVFRDAVIDGQAALAVGSGDKLTLSVLDLRTGQSKSIENPEHAMPVGFAGGRSVLTRRQSEGRILIERVDLDTGSRARYGEIQLANDGSKAEIQSMHIASDSQTYVYSLSQSTSSLFVVTGWS
jgi:hypothetical protein